MAAAEPAADADADAASADGEAGDTAADSEDAASASDATRRLRILSEDDPDTTSLDCVSEIKKRN